MPFAPLLALVAAAGGTLATYLYEREAPLAARVCAGVCTGWATLGLVGFVAASVVGLTPVALVAATAVSGAPLALLARRHVRERVRADAGETAAGLRRAFSSRGAGARGVVVFYAAAAVLFWLLFGRVMFERAGEIYTGVDNALGDLPFHLSIITSFAHGDNFPPVHTELDGARLTYPFIVDFVAAMFVRAGASLGGALFWQNYVLALAFTGLLHRWAWTLTRSRAAALLTPPLVLLGGGLGWLKLLNEWRASGVGLFALLARLPHDYSIGHASIFRLGNALTTLLIPQRTLLLGLPLALIVWTLWWQATRGEGEEKGVDDWRDEKNVGDARPEGGKSRAKKRRAAKSHQRSEASEHPADTARVSSATATPRPLTPAAQMFAAGLVAGLLPLVHAHSFVVMAGMAGCLALLFRREWRAWAVFFVAAFALAGPQMLWATLGSAVRGGTFFGWEPGWDNGEHNVVLFWLANAGLLLPLLVAAVAWRGTVTRRLLLFYLPFTLCFVLPNLFKFSPFVWDNIKLLFYWWIASAPLVALALARLWRGPRLIPRAAVVASLVALLAAGSLDVWRVVSRASEQREFTRDGVALAELIKARTAPRSLILHAPTYNHPSFLTGRRSVMGYAGHLWTHGLDYAERERDVQRVYAGGPDADATLGRLRVDYVVVGPLERATLRAVNENFFQRYTKVGEAGAYRLYQTRR
ncbi:MAG TPA: hypothetical protein VER08_07175 [Pyrinomonadaceae bacterium]|nr:hypothetical protein [Pyrinomonadaceae bacterium]